MVDMKAVFFEMTLNIMMMMIAGKRYYGDSAGKLRNLGGLKRLLSNLSK